MKILQLGKFYPIKGGVERVMLDLTTGLNQSGYHCDMLCVYNDKAPFPGDLVSEHILLCKQLSQLASTMISPALVMRLRKIAHEYDVVHIHHPDPMAALALWLSGYKGKVVLHWHSDILRQKKLLMAYKPLQDWLIKRADLILGTTPRYVMQSPFLEKVQDKCDYLLIGTDKVKPDPELVARYRAEYAGKKIVMSVGRLVPYKGMAYLIEAARYLQEDYVILIGGTGPLEAALEHQISSDPLLKERVRLLGYLSNEEKYALYEASRVFCLSSIQKTEAYAVVQVEAMSVGTPIVATDIYGSGVPWVNADGRTGYNVEPENTKALSEAILAIGEDQDLYNYFSAEALLRYQALFTKEDMIRNMIEFYQNL